MAERGGMEAASAPLSVLKTTMEAWEDFPRLPLWHGQSHSLTGLARKSMAPAFMPRTLATKIPLN
jgi:hypothetical protein